MENNNHMTDETDDTAEDTADNLNADGKLDWKYRDVIIVFVVCCSLSTPPLSHNAYHFFSKQVVLAKKLDRG